MGVEISVLLDGKLIQASGIARFTFIPTGREYIMYTLNEKVPQNGVDLNKIYVAETGEGGAQLSMISDDDWSAIKVIMGEIGKENAEVPNNIQLGVLTARQYTIGPHKKIAINDDVLNNIINTQMNKQPKGESEIMVKPEVETSNPEAPAYQDAFNMSATEIEQTAPIALVDEQPIQETVSANETVPAPTPIAVEQVQPVVKEQTIPVTQVVVQQPVEQPAAVDINQSVQNVISYCDGNLVALGQLFQANGLNISIVDNNVNTQSVVTESTTTQSVVTQEPQININDLPVASQPVVLPTEELSEETIVPSAPTLPVDNAVETNNNIVQEQTIPVRTQIIEQPVQNQIVQQTVEPVQTEVVNQVVTQPVVQEVQQPVAQPEVINQTQLVTPTPQPKVSTATQLTQEALNSEVSFNIPEEVATPQVQTTEPVSTIPVAPVVPEVTQVQQVQPVATNDVKPITVNVESLQTINQSPSVEEDKSFINTAGPVVLPIGQETTTAVGTPGDSASK